jgi:hypothetical protein
LGWVRDVDVEIQVEVNILPTYVHIDGDGDVELGICVDISNSDYRSETDNHRSDIRKVDGYIGSRRVWWVWVWDSRWRNGWRVAAIVRLPVNSLNRKRQELGWIEVVWTARGG